MMNVFRHMRVFPLLAVVLIAACKKESLFVKKFKPETSINAGDPRFSLPIIHLVKDTVYVLTSNLRRDSGQSLVIDAGTIIKINDRVSININPGATIEANGTAADPIVFTSSAPGGGAGYGTGGAIGAHTWNGIRILGNANNTNSGTLTYVRIEFGGSTDILGASLLLRNVGSGTTLNNVQVSYSFTGSAFDFSGGSFNARNLVSYASDLHDFYFHDGYQGKLQNLLSYRHPYFPQTRPGFFLAGMMISGSSTWPIVSNLTVIGPNNELGTSITYLDTTTSKVGALVTSEGARFNVANSALLGFPVAAWYLDDLTTANSITSGESSFKYSVVHSNDTSRTFYIPPSLSPPLTAKDFKEYMLQPQFGNLLFTNASQFNLQDPFNYDVDPDPLPQSSSPLLSGATFDGPFTDPFFEQVSYRGAVGPTNWMEGWTNFRPLQTNYNF